MRWVLPGIAGLLILAIAAIVVAVFVVVDEDNLRDRFQTIGSEVLGLNVTIDGPIRIGFWPAPNITVEEVRVARGDLQIAEIDLARVHLAIAPLFAGRLRPRHLALTGTDLHIVRDTAGRFGFQALDPGPNGAERLPSISFSGLSLSYVDEGAGTRTEASGCEGRFPELALTAGADGRRLARMRLDGEAACETVRWQDFVFSDVGIHASLHEGLGRLNPVTLTLFGGEGRGRLESDFAAEPPRVSLDFVLNGFELEELLRTFEPDATGEGRMNLSAELSATGDERQAMERSVEGAISLHGEGLILHGVDIDKQLADYKSTQRFGLVDVGAVLFAGPIGLVFTKGRDFSRLLRDDEGTTEFRKVVSEWTVSEGVANAVDVAAATSKNRLAALGKVDFAAQRFDGLNIMLLDKRGCAVVTQAVTGPFSDPQVEEPGAAATILGPLIDLVQSGIDTLTDTECEVVYDGAVQ